MKRNAAKENSQGNGAEEKDRKNKGFTNLISNFSNLYEGTYKWDGHAPAFRI